MQEISLIAKFDLIIELTHVSSSVGVVYIVRLRIVFSKAALQKRGFHGTHEIPSRSATDTLLGLLVMFQLFFAWFTWWHEWGYQLGIYQGYCHLQTSCIAYSHMLRCVYGDCKLVCVYSRGLTTVSWCWDSICCLYSAGFYVITPSSDFLQNFHFHQSLSPLSKSQ